jgi:uncharacterized protein (TIGR00251 family)
MKITVVVKPNAKNEMVEVIDGVYYVRTKAPAVDGKANDALVRIIAKHLKVPRRHVRIVRGLTGRNKVVEILE